MTSDQQLVATLGLLLLAVVIFTTYRPYLQAVFLGSPSPVRRPVTHPGSSFQKVPGPFEEVPGLKLA